MLCGGDLPALVEDSLNALLQPLAVILLPAHQQRHSLVQNCAVAVAGFQQRDDGPGGVDDLASIGVIAPLACLTALEALAPATVFVLMVYQKLARAPDAS